MATYEEIKKLQSPKMYFLMLSDVGVTLLLDAIEGHISRESKDKEWRDTYEKFYLEIREELKRTEAEFTEKIKNERRYM